MNTYVMEIIDKKELAQHIKEGVENYSYNLSDKDFTCVARIKCSRGEGNVTILEQDADIDDIVLLAVQEYFNTDNPKAWAAHNTTAYEIAKFSVQVAQIVKPKGEKDVNSSL